jgi:FAD/FMN-containing dehydrogenase
MRSALRRRLRWGLLVIAGILVVLLAKPTIHLLRTASNDSGEQPRTPQGFVDDASRMNQTRVAEVRKVSVETERAEQQLAELLQQAKQNGWRVAIAGARHSMGGHTIYPDGIALDMLPLNQMALNAEHDILHVQAGAIWKDVIAYLDRYDRSVAVMQSNNSFSVGGSISVNCHGWQYGRPPIASTVESFHLMQADGSIVRCSREENAELFSLALGGYGLFGVILDVNLRVVPNRRYKLERFLIPADESLATFDQQVQSHPDAAMIYARMNIAQDKFLDEVILNVLYDEPAEDGSIPKLSPAGFVSLRRSIFRGSAESEYGKRLRWEAETELQPVLAPEIFSRNQLLNEGVEVFQNRSAGTTDILHEYFIPRENVTAFVLRLRDIIPRHDGNLLNVTVRTVEEDTDTFLRYADRPMLSFVMLFVHDRTEEADHAMEAMTQALIDASLSLGGRYYLPYRLHATIEQFEAAYPQAKEFFELKRLYDPDEVFQNEFYVKYGKSIDVGQEAN